jgi:3-oxoacyl-[acyl-carrier protein] reductase
MSRESPGRNSLIGKAALVTGGVRGIGLALTRGLLEEGARVFICARTQQGVDRAVSDLQGPYGSRISGTSCDVAEYDQVHQMVQEAEQAMGGLDILINNAGVGSNGYVEKLSVEEWRTTIGTNLSGVFYCCREAIPLMKKRGGGYIINIGSLAGKHAFPGASAYNASKFGLIGFSEALMQEVRYDGIRVSYVMPGSVNTEFGHGSPEDPQITWKLLPEDVAEVVLDLLKMNPRALSSRVELRPSVPKK